jgi:5-methylcytosine-specific restriction endonuclease McrA
VAAGVCKRCGESTGNPDGRQWYCEPCREIRVGEAKRDHQGRNPKARKPCRRCGGPKPPGARRRYCDTCIPLAARDVKERVRRYGMERWPLVRSEQLAAQARRRREDPQWAAEQTRRAAEWVKANPERARELRQRRVLTYRARKRGAHVEHVEPLVVLERDDGVCGICGEDVDPTFFDIDHVIPLARGGEHSYRNVQVAHRRCNARKGARLLDAFPTSLEG